MSAADPISSSPRTLRGRLRSDGPAVLIAAIMTVVVELGAYAAFRVSGSATAVATMAGLAVALVWVILASPVFAAGAVDGFGALLRGGVVADASAVFLIVLWETSRNPQTSERYLSFLVAVEVYCTLAAVTLASIAATWCARTPAGRYILAITTACVLIVLAATLFWGGGLIRETEPPLRDGIARGIVYVNPYCSIASATAERTHFVWQQASVMYRTTLLGDEVAVPPVPWYAAAVVYLGITAVLVCVALWRRQGISPVRSGMLPTSSPMPAPPCRDD